MRLYSNAVTGRGRCPATALGSGHPMTQTRWGSTTWGWRMPFLGAAQIVAWGTLYYAITLLSQPIAASLALAQTWVYGAFTLSLFVSGLLAPLAGRLIDAGEGRWVLSGSAVLAALGFAWLGVADDVFDLYGSWTLLGLAMGCGLYDAAFAVLHRGVPQQDYRRAVTLLTLFGGFASTVFWPLTRWLVEEHGWREAAFCFAALQILVCLGSYLIAVPPATKLLIASGAQKAATVGLSERAVRQFVGLATAFALVSFTISVLSAHLVALLGLGGLSAGDAILVGTLFGPMQVVARVIEYGCASNVRPVMVGSVSFALLMLALVALALAHGTLFWPVLFGLLYGAGNGVMTIIRGTVPAELFPHVTGFGQLLGRLAMPSFIAKSAAPFIFALLLDLPAPREVVIGTLLVTMALAWMSYEFARRS